jgi:hypothetical protein
VPPAGARLSEIETLGPFEENHDQFFRSLTISGKQRVRNFPARQPSLCLTHFTERKNRSPKVVCA